MADRLRKDGFVVIPVLDAGLIRIFRDAFIATMTGFPEFRRHPDDPTKTVDGRVFGEKDSNVVMGGFGAFGNPASFHNPFVRNLRILLRHAVISVFRDLCGDRPVYIEQLFDRMCLRPAGTTVSKEQWHRDLNPTALDGDAVFGGWINLDNEETQFFSCAPGTHTAQTGLAGKNGFQRDERPASPEKVEIPPGHLLIFYQRLLHEVHPRRLRKPSFRQFVCWRITEHKGSTLQRASVHTIVRDQAVPRLPSDQIPPIYGKNHASFHLHKPTGPISWSTRVLKPCCIDPTKNMGHRFMKSLLEYGMPMYPEYDEMETSLLMPNDSWTLPDTSSFEWSVGSIMSMSILRHEPRIVLRINSNF